MWYWHKHRHTDKYNRIQSSEINLYMYSQTIFYKNVKTKKKKRMSRLINGEETIFSTNGSGKIRYPHARE